MVPKPTGLTLAAGGWAEISGLAREAVSCVQRVRGDLPTVAGASGS